MEKDRRRRGIWAQSRLRLTPVFTSKPVIEFSDVSFRGVHEVANFKITHPTLPVYYSELFLIPRQKNL